jgi:hypothetical protein
MYKGVSWHKHSQKWYSYIQANGKMRGLGYYTSQAEAARTYDAEARKVKHPCASWPPRRAMRASWSSESLCSTKAVVCIVRWNAASRPRLLSMHGCMHACMLQ